MKASQIFNFTGYVGATVLPMAVLLLWRGLSAVKSGAES